MTLPTVPPAIAGGAEAQRRASAEDRAGQPGPVQYGSTAGATPVLSVRNLVKEFTLRARAKKGHRVLRAVDDVSFEMTPGQVFGLVGESGCGKSTTGRCVLRLVEPTSGEVFYKGEDLLRKGAGDMRRLRKELQIVFQDPYSSLHPRQRIQDIIAEPMIVQGSDARTALARVPELMEMVQLDPRRATSYPHEFSGGQRQRIGIARALSLDPELVVMDEPLSALDVSVQADIINLLQRLQEQLHLSVLFISHALSVVRYLASEVAVMYLGEIVEIGPAEDVLASPAHPYTKALMSAAPIPDPRKEKTKQRIVLRGEVPSALDPPSGCRFHPRCWLARDICLTDAPALVERGQGHPVACHFSSELASDRASHVNLEGAVPDDVEPPASGRTGGK
jgi:oligopeptide/dipeptide ABC transporter ATP-binding protein